MSKKDPIIIKGPYQDEINYASLIKMQSEQQTFGEKNGTTKKEKIPVKMKKRKIYKRK